MNLGWLVEGVTSRHSRRAFCTTWLCMSIDLIEAAALFPSDRCVSITAFYAHFAAAEETNKMVKQITSSVFSSENKKNLIRKHVLRDLSAKVSCNVEASFLAVGYRLKRYTNPVGSTQFRKTGRSLKFDSQNECVLCEDDVCLHDLLIPLRTKYQTVVKNCLQSLM